MISKTKKCPACDTEYEDISLVVCPADRTMLLMPAEEGQLIGQVLNDRYKLVELVHTGHATSIFKAQYTLMERVVAVKVLNPLYVSDQITIKRFQQNAQALSHITHHNVPTVYDYGFVQSGQPYLVMDFLDGENFQSIVEAKGALSTERCAHAFSIVADALQHCHNMGVIHRDIKPSNFFVVREEGVDTIKLLDFFLCHLKPSSGKYDQNLTQDGEILGTPLYMSPEQCMGQRVDQCSDIYSFGCSMFYALTGNPPFRGENKLETMQMHISKQPPEGVLPQELEQIVFKAMAKKPEDRYQSMQEVGEQLRPHLRTVSTKEKLAKKSWWPF